MEISAKNNVKQFEFKAKLKNMYNKNDQQLLGPTLPVPNEPNLKFHIVLYGQNSVQASTIQVSFYFQPKKSAFQHSLIVNHPKELCD